MSLTSTSASKATSDFYYICELYNSVFESEKELVIHKKLAHPALFLGQEDPQSF
jgi:hypothetical protein